MKLNDFVTSEKIDVGFLSFTINKLSDVMPFACARIWVKQNGYSGSSLDSWKMKNYLPVRVINLIFKDIQIINRERQGTPTFQQLLDEYAIKQNIRRCSGTL